MNLTPGSARDGENSRRDDSRIRRARELRDRRTADAFHEVALPLREGRIPSGFTHTRLKRLGQGRKVRNGGVHGVHRSRRARRREHGSDRITRRRCGVGTNDTEKQGESNDQQQSNEERSACARSNEHARPRQRSEIVGTGGSGLSTPGAGPRRLLKVRMARRFTSARFAGGARRVRPWGITGATTSVTRGEGPSSESVRVRLPGRRAGGPGIRVAGSVVHRRREDSPACGASSARQIFPHPRTRLDSRRKRRAWNALVSRVPSASRRGSRAARAFPKAPWPTARSTSRAPTRRAPPAAARPRRARRRAPDRAGT